MERQAARSISSRAICTVVPNLRDSGQSAPAFATMMRQYTFAPGALSASLRSSSAESKANSETPAAWARRIADTFLMVLPKLIASGRAPASRHASISSNEAASKRLDRRTSRSSTGAAGLAFTA